MINFHNMSALPIIIESNDKVFEIEPRQSYKIDSESSSSFVISHSYTSNYYKRAIKIFKIKVADVVLNSRIDVIQDDVNCDIYIHDIREAVVNPRNLYYNFFNIDYNDCIVNESFIVSGHEKLKDKIKKIDKVDNIYDILGDLFIFLAIEPFFLLAFIFTEFKLLFGLLMVALALFIVCYSNISKKISKRKRNNIFILSNGFEEDFIKMYFSNSKRKPYDVWQDLDFINTKLY